MNIPTNGIAVVDIWADWCQPCKALAREIDLAKGERPDIAWLDLEAEASDENMDFCRNYGVMSFPTLLVFSEGEHVGTLTGAMSKSTLIEKVDNIVGNA